MGGKSQASGDRETRKASFWVETELWERFKQAASDRQTTATSVLVRAIRAYVGEENGEVSQRDMAELQQTVAAIEERLAAVEKRSPVAAAA